MHDAFRRHVAGLPGTLERLLSATPTTCGALPEAMPTRGVCVFAERGVPLYVGRSNRLRHRIRNHGRVGATHRQAAFAIRLAREATGFLTTYTPAGSLAALMLDPAFVAAFANAKRRIATMEVRFVEEADPDRQCLLEVYVHVALATRHNDFDNH